MTKIVSLWEFSGSSARFGISEVLRISPRFYWYIRTCSIITKLSDIFSPSFWGRRPSWPAKESYGLKVLLNENMIK